MIEIVEDQKMSIGMRRYWKALQLKMHKGEFTKTNLIDPWRLSLKELRSRYPKGLFVYRASTGGKYGKSAQITQL